MQQQHYKGYCLTQHNNHWKIEGYTNTFYGLQAAKNFIDLLAQGITKVNGHCKPFDTQKN